jgi:hypothetical protein
MQIALPFLVAQQHTRLVHQSAGVERRQIKLCRSGRLRTLSLKYNNPGSICQRQLLEINVTFQTNVTFYANVTIQVKRPSVELLARTRHCHLSLMEKDSVVPLAPGGAVEIPRFHWLAGWLPMGMPHSDARPINHDDASCQSLQVRLPHKFLNKARHA